MARKTQSVIKSITLIILLLLIVATFLSCTKQPVAVVESYDITISFEVDGDLFHTLKLNTQGEIKLPNDPAKEGYNFGGWFLEKETFTKKLTNYAIRSSKEDFTVYANMLHTDCQGEWHIKEKADCIKTGLRQNVCKFCGKVLESEVIPALGHTILEGETSCSVCLEENPSTIGLTYIINDARTGYLLSGMGTFTGDKVVVAEKYNGLPVVGIAPNSFLNNLTLTSIYFTKDIKIIYDSAFEGCANLSVLTLPENLTSIGKRAFFGCLKLTTVTIPSKVEKLEEQAFGNLSSLLSVTFENNQLENLPDKLFMSCIRLIDIVLPTDLKNIGKEVFSGCSRLESVTMPQNLVSLGERAFAGCNQLNQVVFNGKLENVENNAFYNCSNLTQIMLPNSLTFIGEAIFAGCTKLANLTIPALLAGSYSAPNISKIVLTASVDSKAKVKDFAFNNVVSITQVELSEDIESIGENAFFNCKNLAQFTLTGENKITYIGDYAFGNCESLTAYTFNEATSYIGAGAFTGCKGIEEISIPRTIEIINSSAFSNCINLEKVNFEIDIETSKAKVKSIKQNAFENCVRLTQITLPDSLEEILSYAFASSGLTNITLPNGITSIEKGVFSNCRQLLAINAPYAISIGTNAFYNCVLLSQLDINQDLNIIGDYAFYNCIGLDNFAISDKISSLGEGVFALCNNLDLTVDANNPHYILDETGLYKYSTIYNQKVYETLVKYNSKQTNLDFLIPSTVTKVSDYAFENAKFTTLIVPESVISIGYQNIASQVSVYLESKNIVAWANSFQNANFNYDCNADKNDFEYTKNIDDTYTVSRYIGNSVHVNIPLFYNGKLVTKIGQNTFNNITSFLHGIVIHSKINEIKQGAFDNCNHLYSISVEQSNPYFTTIEGVLFDKAVSILIKFPSKKGDNAYYIPESVHTVYDYAFNLCANLETLIVHSDVTTLGAYKKLSDLHLYAEIDTKPSFWHETWTNDIVTYNCNKNQLDFSYNLVNGYYEVRNYIGENLDVIIPVSYLGALVKHIGNETFFNKPNLTNVEMPNTIETIGDAAFAFCSSLTNLQIPNKVKHIPKDFAKANNSLTKVELSENLISIGDYAFYGGAFSSIVLPESLEEIGDYAFADCIFEEITIPNKVKEINISTFKHNIMLRKVILPDGLTDIKSGAFELCTSLEIISLPKTVINIGDSAFASTKLASIILPESLTTIGNSAFEKTNLTEIILPRYLQNFGVSVFRESRFLAKISIDKNNSYLETADNILYNKGKTILHLYAPSKQNSEFVVPNTVKTIAESAFYESSYLTKITLTENIETIGKFAFYSSGLEAITIPSKVTIINESTFRQCLNLKNIVFSENIITIDKYAFANCAITTLLLPSKLVEIRDSAFLGCTKLQSVPSMPSSLTFIGANSFSLCSSLSSITLSRNLVQIGTRAFNNTALSSITIPVSVTSIGEGVFYDCANLTTIYVINTTIPAGWNKWLEGANENVDVITGFTP